MKKNLATAPAEKPVSLADCKDWSVIEGTDSDGRVGSLIASATQLCEKYLGRRLIAQTWDYFFDVFPSGELTIDYLPVDSVISIKYFDSSGVEQTLSGELYQADLYSEPMKICLASGQSWPATDSRPNAVTVRVVLGYGNAVAVPEPIKTAIKLLVGHLDRNREGSAPVNLTEIPLGVKFHLDPYRVREL